MTKEVYSGHWLNDGYSLFKDRAALNATCNTLYNTHPIVNAIINSHSDIPLNYLHIDYPENSSKVEEFFREQISDLNLLSQLQFIIQGFWLHGESFVYLELNEQKGAWSRMMIQNPDYIIVKRTAIGESDRYYLRPDENLRRIVFSNKEEDKKTARLLDAKLVAHIKNGENIPLDTFYLSHLVRKVSPYEVRGTSLLCPILKLLMNDFETTQEMTARQIRICLMDPFLNENVNMQKIKSSYRNLFTMLGQWSEKKIFSPIAKINDFYQIKDGDKSLCVPKLRFDLEALMQALKE